MKQVFRDDDFYFYYVKVGTNPLGCVALRQDGSGNWARGISICSFNEPRFVKKDARRRAKGRCLRALFNKDNQFPIGVDIVKLDGGKLSIRHPSVGVFREVTAAAFDYKSEYGAVLTEKEIQITDKKDKPLFTANNVVKQSQPELPFP